MTTTFRAEPPHSHADAPGAGSAGARSLTLAAAGGRRLDVLVSGETGTPLVLQHGTPGSALQFGPWAQAALARGLRFVTYARPGYGASDRLPGRSVADAAADVATILDALDAPVCVTVGASGGGPHALATAALLPDRTSACSTVGGLGPFGAAGLDFFEGMGQELRIAYRLAAAGDEPGLLRFMTDGAQQTAMIDRPWERLAAPDVAALQGPFGRFLHADAQEALRSGPLGWFDECLAFVRPWRFDVAAITVPVIVWQGLQDRVVPPAHGRWVAARIARAQLRLEPAHGHLSLGVDGFERILDELLGAAPQSAPARHGPTP